MIDTTETMKLVEQEVQKIVSSEVTVDKLVSDIKNIIIRSMSKRGITVEDSIAVSSKLIVLATIV